MTPQIVRLALVSNIAHAGPDEDALGKSAGYPLPTYISFPWADQYKVAIHSNRAALSPHCLITPSVNPLKLKRSSSEPTITYTYQNQNLRVDDFMNRRRVTGLIVLKDDEVLVERYAYDRNSSHKMLGNSMAKTIVSLGIGIALKQGKIKSLEDVASKYVGALKDTLYGETKLISLLRMSSGVKVTEDYTGNDDLARFHRIAGRTGTVDALKTSTERVEPEGSKFKYASFETRVLALALEGATGKPICDYIAENVWQPIGAEGSATWIYENQKKEVAAEGDFSATLRDWARLGYALSNDGAVNGNQVFDKEYILNMTDIKRQPRAFWPRVATPYDGYGLHIWLLESASGKRRFYLQGIYGQAVFIDPERKIVMVQTAVEKAPGGTGIIAEGWSLFKGVVTKYGNW